MPFIASPVIPPGQEALVLRMVDPATGLPPGWRRVRCDVDAGEIRVAYAHTPRGITAALTLAARAAPPDAPAPREPDTRRFALRVRASRGADPRTLVALVSCVRAAVAALEEDLAWAPAYVTDTEATDGAVGYADELDEHLQLVPYVTLDARFDRHACLAEAEALADRFVPYRGAQYDNGDAWRVLPLRAPAGDERRAALSGGDDHGHPEGYASTPAAAQCPALMAALGAILDLPHCHQVLLLSLEPGGLVAPHSDNENYPVIRSVSVALNMPAGCEFVLDTEPDGTHHAHTVAAPFGEGGTALLLNVARYHYVRNRSRERRIHVVARGPLRATPAELLARARSQNGVHDRAALRAALAARGRDAFASIAR